MSSHDPFGHLKHKLWPKERVGVKLSIWFPTTYCWKGINKRYNFVLNLISIRGLHTKLWAPKIVGVPILGISKLPFWGAKIPQVGALGQNDIWVPVPWPGTKYTIRGKVVASLKSKPWWVLWVCVCPWLVHAPKCSNYALTNLLFNLCKSMWVVEMLVNLPSPIPELEHAPLPSKCCDPWSTPQLFFLSLFSLLDSQLNPSRSLGVRHKICCVS
jgi:hypothetical protein